MIGDKVFKHHVSKWCYARTLTCVLSGLFLTSCGAPYKSYAPGIGPYRRNGPSIEQIHRGEPCPETAEWCKE